MRLSLDMNKTLLIFLLPTLLAGQGSVPALDRVVLAMGTELRLHLEGAEARLGSEAALAECARIERDCSTWNSESSWSLLNAAQSKPVRLSQEWLGLLAEMKAWSQRTEGAFDPVLMALMQVWGVRTGGHLPNPADIRTAQKASGSDLLVIDPEAGTAQLRVPEAGVEEGGFLKGYALDTMRKRCGSPRGWLDFGGQILAWGGPRRVSIADPHNRNLPRLSLDLENGSLSSSGTSERGRHILDPRSGNRCEAWGATAVVAPEALSADVLSTALYVMGPGAGLAWAERHQVAAAFLLNDGSLRMSRAFLSLNPKDERPESR